MISRNERMKQVERYVSHAMSTEEKAAFRARLERDADLRRMVDAEEFVFRTLRHDRDAAPRDHERTRTRVLAVLASAGAAGAGTSSAEAAQAAVQGTAQTGAGGTAVGGAVTGGVTLLKSVLVVVVSGVVLTSAWFLAGPFFTDDAVSPAVEQRIDSERIAPAPRPADAPAAIAPGSAAQPVQSATESVRAATPAEPTLRQAARSDGRSGLSVEPAAGEGARDTLRMKLQVTLPK